MIGDLRTADSLSESNHLRQRVRELSALHEVARLLERIDLAMPVLLERVALLLAPAFQHSATSVARVSYGSSSFETTGYRPTPWRLLEEFCTSDGCRGTLDVAYLREHPTHADGPFLAEERALLQTVADMLRSHLERRLAEERARRTQEQLGIALASVDMGFWEWHVPSNRVVWSEEFARLCGLSTSPLVIRYMERLFLIHPDDQAPVAAAVQEATDDPERRTLELEFRIQPADGDQRWLLAKAHIFRDETGRCSRVLAVVIDVTKRHLLQDQFLHAQKMHALGQFAGGIAHDFNNILTVIIGQCDMVRMTDMSPATVHEGLKEISAAAGRAAYLTRQLLAFSRKGDASPQLIDPSELLSQLGGFMGALVGQHELRVVLDHHAGLIRVDPRQLEQAILNLVVNARDAIPHQGVITVRTATVGDDGVAIIVSDTGTGMDESTRARIFEPFFTTKRAGEGTGLGLAVVLSVVEEAGGSVHVETAPDQGTTFELRFPRAT